MIKERGNFPRLKFKGIQPSLNIGADEIEDRLGIVFSTKPDKVEWNRRNIIALFANSVLSPELFVMMIRSKSWQGVYLSDFHTFINQSSPNDHLTDYHENMHGFVQLVNPPIHDYRGQIKKSFNILFEQGHMECETPIVNRCLTEGTAVWGEVQMGLKSQDSFLQTTACFRHNWWLNDGASDELLLNRAFIDTKFEMAYKFINAISDLPNSKTINL